MGTYFPPLNLSLDADERAVKRAYAAKLKETRPDDDPAAFQALVSARDRALDWVRRRAPVVAPAIVAQAEADQPESASGDTADMSASLRGDLADDGSYRLLLSPADLAQLIGGISPDIPSVPDDRDAPTDILTIADAPERRSLAAATPLPAELTKPTEPSFSAMVRAQHTTRQVLAETASNLIRQAKAGADTGLEDRWAAVILAAEDLDLASRMALERAIAIDLDTVMQMQARVDPTLNDAFAATVLTLDKAFRWSEDPRRVARVLGEPSGTHPLVFAIERFGVAAVRLRLTSGGFPLIPPGDIAAWFGSDANPGVTYYQRAAKVERFGFSWSWYALLSPPAWCIRTGYWPAGIGIALAAITCVYVLFDPITNVDNANSFVAFLAVVTFSRLAFALSARTLEINALVRLIGKIETGALPTPAERRRRIAAGHGSKLLNIIVGMMFLLLVDGYALGLIIPAMSLKTALVGQMIAVPDRKTQGVTFADRLVAESYLDHARQIIEELDDLAASEKQFPPNPLRQARVEALQKTFLITVNSMPIGDYTVEFARVRREIAQLKHRQ